MKITIEDIGPEEEDEIIIRCRNLDSHFLELIYSLKMKTRKISGSRNGNIFMISLKKFIILKQWTTRSFCIAARKFMKQRGSFMK